MIDVVYDAVLIDIHEQNSGIIHDIKKKGLALRVETLHKGDFAVSQRVGGEIKRIKKTNPHVKKRLKIEDYNDLVASLRDNRLYTEIDGLNKLYEINVLIIEIEEGADFLTSSFAEKHWKALRMSLEIGFNTHIYYTQTQEETIDLIYALWEREKKGKHYVSPCNKKPRPKTLKDQQMYFLSGLMDVGDKSSKELLQLYRTPLNVIDKIRYTVITYTAGGNPRKPKDAPAGYGPQFFLKNQRLLQGDNIEIEKIEIKTDERTSDC